MLRLHGYNVLRLRLLHCLCYPEFSLGNKASNPNAAATMLLWWSKLTRIFTLKIIQASEKVSIHFYLRDLSFFEIFLFNVFSLAMSFSINCSYVSDFRIFNT